MFSRKCDQEIQTFYLHLSLLYQLRLISNFLCESYYPLRPSSHLTVIQRRSVFYLKAYYLMELDSSPTNFEAALFSWLSLTQFIHFLYSLMHLNFQTEALLRPETFEL